MIKETSYIRVLFTVICGTPDGGCPAEERLKRFRILSEKPEDPKLIPQWTLEREKFVNTLQAKHFVTENQSSLIDVGHYSVNTTTRDVFVGLAIVPDQVLARNETMLLEMVEPAGRTYFNDLFSTIFEDLNEEDDNDFTWLTWVIVPLVEAFDGRFNPGGMGGSGR